MLHIFNKVSSKMATISIAFDGGARSEGDTFTLGLAHMMEHMCFKGTLKRSWKDINRQIAFIGGQTNAFTSQEMVCYYIYVPYENLAEAMEIISDQVFCSTIPEEEFLKEWEVVKQEEIGRSDSPTHELFTTLTRNMMPGRLGEPVIGTKESIDAFTHKELQTFYKQVYRRSGAVVSLAANCDKDIGAALLDKYFGEQDGFSLSAPTYEPEEIMNDTIIVRKPNLEHAYACVCMHGLDMYDPRENGLEIISSVLGGGMDSRLFEEVRENRGLAYSIGSSVSSHREIGHFLVTFQTEVQNIEEVITVVEDEIAKMAEHGITEEELRRTKNKIRSHVYSLQDSTMGVAQDGLKRAMFGLKSLEEDMEELAKITVDDISELSHSMLSDVKKMIVISKNENG